LDLISNILNTYQSYKACMHVVSETGHVIFFGLLC